jgi:hypothetical protein
MNILQRIGAALGRFNRKAGSTAVAASAQQPAAGGTAVDNTVGVTIVTREVEEQTGEEAERSE